MSKTLFAKFRDALSPYDNRQNLRRFRKELGCSDLSPEERNFFSGRCDDVEEMLEDFASILREYLKNGGSYNSAEFYKYANEKKTTRRN